MFDHFLTEEGGNLSVVSCESYAFIADHYAVILSMEIPKQIAGKEKNHWEKFQKNGQNEICSEPYF